MDENVKNIADTVKPTLDKYGISYAGIFGSQARGDAGPDSDVDIMVSPGNKTFSVWDTIGLRNELSELLKKRLILFSKKPLSLIFGTTSIVI